MDEVLLDMATTGGQPLEIEGNDSDCGHIEFESEYDDEIEIWAHRALAANGFGDY